ncbi:MAG: PD40 domain-containing protein [Acidobacteria bacterium]|nr:PD40 domain-containing protein [Acidobacteriota bacterium]
MFKTSILFVVVFVLSLTVVSAQNAKRYMTEPSFSPDRKEIAFVSGGDVWTVPAAGGTASLLVSHPANESKPLYSPDGRKLAFGSNRTGGGDIYVLDLASGDLKRITYDDANEQLDSWSRDGNWLYFSSTSRDIAGMNDVYRVSSAGGTPMQVSSDRFTNEFGASPLADGSIIFAARGISSNQWWRHGRSHIDETELWQKNGEAYTELTDRGAKQLWPMATADGSHLYYVSDRGGQQNLWSQNRGSQAKAITSFTDGRVLWPSLSYDGEEIVFERNFGIWKTKTSGGKPQEVPVTLRGAASSPIAERINLSTQIREFVLSPDGKKVAVIARGEVFAGSAKEGGDAAQVTDTPAAESHVTWSPDSKRIVYASERDGSMDLFQYEFATETESRITGTPDADAAPSFSPDGKSLAFIRNSRAVFIYDIDSKREREVSKIFADPSPLLGREALQWSPDNKWIAFLTNAPENRSYVNVNVVPAAGGPARPISFLSNSNSSSLAWSPDGSYILFDSSQRTEEGIIARIDLKLRTPRFREDQFRDLFRQENPQDRRPPLPASTPTPAPSPTASPEKKDAAKNIEIVFEDIKRRASFINTGVDNGNVAISPDGKTLLISASAEGQMNLYTRSLEELATDNSSKQITSTPGFKSQAQFSPDSKEVFYIENGRINIVGLERRDVRPLSLNININVDFAREKMEVFKQGWRFLRDNFYDDKYHGADWNAVRATYEPLISSAKTIDEVRRLMNMMVGELNASHLGVGGQSGSQPAPIGKLGLRFDRNEFETNGRLKITEIIALSPAAVAGGIRVGDHLLSVDGTAINGRTNLDELLENKVGRRVVLGISSSPDGTGKHDVVLKPVSTGAEKNLLYRQWVEDNRAYIARISGGRIGYVHIPDMSANSLTQLYADLDVDNQAKEGVVVDIRNNNGGFVNVYVIDVLARKGYLTMKQRGFWDVPARSNLGQRALERPTVLVTNQHSLSDAEDMTEGYRTLKLGKVVGEPTAGWIIFTWNTQLFDGTTLRLPMQKITGSDGKNMELNPRQVDVPVTRPIGETLTGKDSQLDRAVRELTASPRQQ